MMFFYDNQLDLDEFNQLPLNYVSAIELDQNDKSKAWIGCTDGHLYHMDIQNLQSDYNFVHEQNIADLLSIDNHLICLSKNKIQLFNVQQSIRQSDKIDRSSRSNKRSSNKKRKLINEEDQLSSMMTKDSLIEDNNLVIKLGSHSALSCLCKISEYQILLAGGQSDMLLFDINQCRVINKFPLLNSAPSCFKMKKMDSKNLIVTAAIGGQMSFYDQKNDFKPVITYKAFNFSNADFDIIDDNYILTSGSNNSYSNTSKNLKVFDIRTNKETILSEESRFYRTSFIKSLSESSLGYDCLALDKNGSGGLCNLNDDFKNLLLNSKRFSIPVQPNATICSYEVSSELEILLTSDKNGYLHSTSLTGDKLNSDSQIKSNERVKSNNYDILTDRLIGSQHTKHVQINDISQSTDDLLFKTDEPLHDFYETKRDFKIRPHYFLRQSLGNTSNPYQNCLKEIFFN